MSRSRSGWPLTRRELLVQVGRAALASPLLNLTFLSTSCAHPHAAAPPAAPVIATTSNEVFLDELQRASFLYFWEQCSPSTGQVKDRALAGGNDIRSVSSIAATGFGLSALCAADKRGYNDSAQIKGRVLNTLNFLWNQMPHEHGFFYHYVDMNTGARDANSELSSIDTAILLCGVLTCRQYFHDSQIQALATQIYERVDFTWMLNQGTTFSQGWHPEAGFLPTRWDTYSELMMLYLLAIGSPTHPIPPSSWQAFARPIYTFEGLTYITPVAPLFIHQFSHAWFDFRNRRDAFADYFNNSMVATQAHKLFCISLQDRFPHYSSNQWGVSTSDSVHGYIAWGGPPLMGAVDGSIVPCAAAGSLPFAPTDCIAVLRGLKNQYPDAWQRYGFVDAFNPLTGWYDSDVVGIDQGITFVMAENERTGFIWDTFMKNPEPRAAMAAVGLNLAG